MPPLPFAAHEIIGQSRTVNTAIPLAKVWSEKDSALATARTPGVAFGARWRSMTMAGLRRRLEDWWLIGSGPRPYVDYRACRADGCLQMCTDLRIRTTHTCVARPDSGRS